jgi:hypothetical protein
MTEKDLTPLSADELAAEAGTALPPKEVVSLLDLNVDLDLALDLAAPIDLAVAANANVVAPIDAAVGANILSFGSSAQSLADQGVMIDQGISGSAVANSAQDSTLDQSNDVPDAGSTAPADGGTVPADGTTVPTDGTAPADGSDTADPSSLLDGDLLDVNVHANLDADIAAPIAGAVAANANVAAPIDAAVSANVGSIDSSATAIASQQAIITQHLDDVTAEANTDQQSDITQ